jgi:hypothetical protein
MKARNDANAANAPRATTVVHWSASGARASCTLSAQTTRSQSSTAGSATLAPAAVSVSQAANPLAPNTMPIAITPCTKTSARRTTPTWQTSNADSGPRRIAGVAATTSKTVLPKSVERGAVPPGAGATMSKLIGDEAPPIESRESRACTCSGLSPTDARSWGVVTRATTAIRAMRTLGALRAIPESHVREPVREESPRPGRRAFRSRRALNS